LAGNSTRQHILVTVCDTKCNKKLPSDPGGDITSQTDRHRTRHDLHISTPFSFVMNAYNELGRM